MRSKTRAITASTTCRPNCCCSPLSALEQEHKATRVAIAMDVRSAILVAAGARSSCGLRSQGVTVIGHLPGRHHGHAGAPLFRNPARHPLSRKTPARCGRAAARALVDAIELERELLADLREQALVIDTSIIRPSQLQGYVKSLIVAAPPSQLTLVFESFAFKRGIPVDADYVFDVRMLPNPHYEPELRH
jgi:UPF0042 nucleotide-binding protein